jgi:hypothetical protein
MSDRQESVDEKLDEIIKRLESLESGEPYNPETRYHWDGEPASIDWAEHDRINAEREKNKS